MTSDGSRDAAFEAAQPRLFGLAYRMLGSVMEAEDVVQDAWLRWRNVDAAAIREPAAFLTTVTTRLCMDRLRSARARRETYVGPWLPEPLVTEPDAAEHAELADSLATALLVLLEKLSPAERAAFLLRDVFGYGYDEIAGMVERSPQACRQLVSRARARLGEVPSGAAASRAQGWRLAETFLAACATGDVSALMALLAPDAVLLSDGGGHVQAARNPVHGAERVARFLVGIVAKAPDDIEAVVATVNGQPGAVLRWSGVTMGTIGLDIGGDVVNGVHIVVNPHKLQHLSPPDR